jgi:hypothetical protein
MSVRNWEMRRLCSPEELEHTVLELGFLPFFRNAIPNFSVEALTPAEYWFVEGVDGPWDWKAPVIRNCNCTYGRFFWDKAGYVSLEWLPDWANYRRAAYHSDILWGNSNIDKTEMQIYEAVVEHESLLTREVKQLCGLWETNKRHFDPADGLRKVKHVSPGRTTFETAMTHLQMATFIVIADFEYRMDKHNKPYGWGVARYTTPEALFGKDVLHCNRTPDASRERLVKHFKKILPQVTETEILKMIG